MKKLICLLSVLVAVACTANQEPGFDNSPVRNHQKRLPIDERFDRPTIRAVHIALDAMDELFHDKFTKITNGEIGYDVCYYTETELQSVFPDYEPTGQDTLMYLITFSNSNGFAMIAQDLRILGISDSGTITINDFTTAFDDTPQQRIPERQPIGTITRLTNCLLAFGQAYDSPVLRDSVIWDSVGQYTTDTKVGPLVPIKLNQNAPFNTFCFVANTTIPAYVGCVPVALANIFAANRTPNGMGGYPGNWASIISDWDTTLRTVPEPLPQWLAYIGREVNADYGAVSDGTGTPASVDEAYNYMLRLENIYHCYHDVTMILQPTYSDYISSVRSGKTVFCAGKNSTESGGAHAWVFDGYWERQYTYYYEYLFAGVGESVKKDKLIHCNWGWGGICDGYYGACQSIFDLNSPSSILDRLDRSESRNLRYAHADFYCIITYNL